MTDVCYGHKALQNLPDGHHQALFRAQLPALSAEVTPTSTAPRVALISPEAFRSP